MAISPIALFVYNRPEHTKKTVESLLKNQLASQSDLIIFSDAPRNDLAQEGVIKVRNYIKTIQGFKSVTVIERETNFGLAKSIISGVTELISRYGKIIVLEDDLITSPYFLSYMNEALDFYENQEKVISIHGYIYPVKRKLPETFFLKGADCWGWATWKRGWDLFEADGKKLLKELNEKKLTRKFDFDGAYPYTQMLEGQIRGFNNSWAIRWHASAFLNEKLTLYPGESLVVNAGFDDSGTHTGSTKAFDSQLCNHPINVGKIAIEENPEALEAVKGYFNSPKLKMITSFIRLKYLIKRFKSYVKGNR